MPPIVALLGLPSLIIIAFALAVPLRLALPYSPSEIITLYASATIRNFVVKMQEPSLTGPWRQGCFVVDLHPPASVVACIGVVKV